MDTWIIFDETPLIHIDEQLLPVVDIFPHISYPNSFTCTSNTINSRESGLRAPN